MALKAGSSQDIIQENVAELVKVGYMRDHACAIAEASACNYRDLETAEAARRTAEARTTTAQVFDRASFYTTHQLGKTRRLTPEGFLVIEGVPIARTGEQIYREAELNGPGEPIIKGDVDGIVIVTRRPEEVFRPATMASFEGKPITIEHPSEFVTPETHKLLSIGHHQNVRQGEGIEDDLLLADFVITDPMGIKYANEKLPDVSAGYNAGYAQDQPGRADCINILGNHSALVERGRAGPRVSIRDAQPPGDTKVKLRDVVKLFLPSLATNDNAAVTAALDTEVPGLQPATTAQQPTIDSAVAAELKKLGERFDTMDAQVKDLAKKVETKDDDEDETEEEKKKRLAAEAKQKSEDEELEKMEATDTVLEPEGTGTPINLGTVYTGDSAGGKPDAYREIVSRAEILAPGIQIPTKDSLKGSKGATLAKFMRATLDKCATTDAGKEVLPTFLMGRKINDLAGHALLGVFNGTASLVGARNNRRSASVASVRTGDFGKATTVASINEANKKFWANGGK